MNELSKENVSLVPRLRFAEFLDDPAWVETTLGNLFLERQESGVLNLPLLSLTEKDGIIRQDESNRKDNSNSDKSKYLRVLPGDIAYNTMRMWEGRSSYSRLEGMVSPAYTVCAPKANVNGLFFSYFFKNPQLINQFRRYSQGLVKDTLNLKFSEFSKIRTCLPSPNEQKRIGECLASLDILIIDESNKLEALKEYKKGLSQLFFPIEGKTEPRQRFPKYRDATKWVSTTLGAVAKIQSGGTPSRTNPDYWGGGIPWVTTSLIDLNLILDAEEYITNEGLIKSSAKIFPKGTILMAMYGQGKTRGQVAMLGIDAATNQACAALIPKLDINTNFILQNLASRYDEIRKISNPGGQENLSAGLIESILFSYPEDPAEQEMLASFFSSVDGLSVAQRRKIDVLKIHKKGLMQHLFPIMNVVQP